MNKSSKSNLSNYGFIDWDTTKHKHDYSVESVALIKYKNGMMTRHHVMRCSCCYSFKAIKTSGNSNGLILSGIDVSILPKIYLDSYSGKVGFAKLFLNKQLNTPLEKSDWV